MMNKMSIKKDDTVVVITGKDKGQRGKVLTVIPKEGKVVVEKINLVSRHTKPRKQGDEGGIIQKEAPLYACKVMRVCPKCDKPTRAKEAVILWHASRLDLSKNHEQAFNFFSVDYNYVITCIDVWCIFRFIFSS